MAEDQVDLNAPRPSVGEGSGWPRTVQLVPSQDRLSQSHSVVSIRNNGINRHVVIDRHLQGHEIAPGQTARDVELLNSDVEHFRRLRQPRFGAAQFSPTGQALGRQQLPVHDLEVLDVRSPEQAEEEQKLRAKQQAEQDKRTAEARAAGAEGDQSEASAGAEDPDKPRARRR